MLGQGGSKLATTFQLGRESSAGQGVLPPGDRRDKKVQETPQPVLTIPEAQRFTPIRKTIFNRWDVGTSINSVDAKWRDLPCALLVSEKTESGAPTML